MSFSLIIVLILVVGYFLVRSNSFRINRSARVLAWLSDPSAHPEWSMHPGERCGNAPFIFPTAGFIGYIWGDSFGPGHRHQGIDIFGGSGQGETPVIAVFPGYLTRLTEWISSLIIRIPEDPLYPDRQIWVYYTHMADPQGNSFISAEFPPGVSGVYIEAGTLLGYQGNFSGDAFNPTGIHLHFSIVKDERGRFKNELDFDNTLDPSPYLGILLNANDNQHEVPLCRPIDEVNGV